MIEKNESTLKVASFFSGIGGFDLGFERTGMKIVFQCEKNLFNRRVLERHWPKIFLHEDINTLELSDIPESDIWCAGFPCQDLSLANNGKRQGLNGDRSGLFFRFAELVGERKPRWVVLENVPGLLNSKEGQDFRHILAQMDEFGYGVAWRILDSKFFGTPQRRRRVFIVASFGTPRALQVLFDDPTTEFAARTSKSQEQTPSTRDAEGDRVADLYSIQHAAIGRIHTAGPQSKGYRADGETWTLDSRGSADAVCAPYDPFGMRDTPGFPPRVDKSRYRSIGNAVTVHVVEWIARRILAQEEFLQETGVSISSMSNS